MHKLRNQLTIIMIIQNKMHIKYTINRNKLKTYPTYLCLLYTSEMFFVLNEVYMKIAKLIQYRKTAVISMATISNLISRTVKHTKDFSLVTLYYLLHPSTVFIYLPSSHILKNSFLQ